MKLKSKAIILGMIALMLAGTFFPACSNQESQNPTSDKDRNLYSNLLDQESQEKISVAMEDAGILAENIELFLRQVSMFNDDIENYGLVKEGFKNPVSIEPEYDPYEMQDLFYEKNPDFTGYNCRITSYELMRGLIHIENPVIGDTNIIIFDENSIEYGPEKIFSESEFTEFKSLYSAIPTEKTQDIKTHVEKVKKDWEAKGISFTGDATLISVFFHEEDEPEDYLFIGHVGVLVPAEEGYYFIEKVAFQEPYQVILFHEKADLNDYLLEKYDLSWGQDTASPFVMENLELMVD